ncbi:MAG TPA: hypothetical protein VGQ37_14505 [Vicinamibacterales bacterium]|jgi:predicted outer membrane lipoprotein|nr:hypothetical protein [Vicinamibacterales bacterium]
MSRFALTLGLLLAGAVTCVEAQWLNHRDPRIPRTADGKPNLSAPAPRVNGTPDLSGVWQTERTPPEEFTRVLGPGLLQLQVDIADITKYVLNVFWGTKPGEEPLRPEGAAKFKEHQSSGRDFQGAYCLPTSLPGNVSVLAFKMIHAPGEIVVMPGTGDPARQIYTDGRGLPKEPEPNWTGYSVGTWQGDTLVVETVGITTRAWLDGFGHPRSDAMRITERYRRRDVGHMDVEVSFDDPTYYTRPFGFKTTATLLPDTDVLEYICTENQKLRVR